MQGCVSFLLLRSYLPLLLSREETDAARSLGAQDRSYYSSIELSDLRSPVAPERIALTLSDRTNSTTSAQAGGAADGELGEGEGEGGEGGGGLEERFRRRERETVEGVREEWEGRVGEVRRFLPSSLFGRSRH